MGDNTGNLGDFVGAAWIARHGLDPAEGMEQVTPDLIPDLLRHRSRRLAGHKAWARRRKDWDRYLLLQGHSRVLPAFIEIASELDGPDFWRLLGKYVWDHAEQIQPRSVVSRLLARDPTCCGAMMTPAERRVLARLPDALTVYRGAGDRRDLESGFSWTLSQERAEFFARRFSGDRAAAAMSRLTHPDPDHDDLPVVARGRIRKQHVIAYRGERQEREIVALPESVTIEWVREL